MSVKYSLTARYNPRKPNDPKKIYAQSQSYGEITFDEMCQDISERCTLTKADIAAAIEGTLVSIEHSLRKGEAVRFGEFGSFKVGISSKGTETEKEFNAAMIKKSRVLFHPGKMLSSMLKSLEYTQVPVLPKKEKKGKKTDDKNAKVGDDKNGKEPVTPKP